MLISPRVLLALCASCITLAVLVPTAVAGAPATVTVRVEGLNETKLPPTQVTTTTASVVKDGKSGDACTGTSAAGALELATGGNWGGPWSSSFKQYEIFSIEGEEHVFEKGAAANYFWTFWLDEKEASQGACAEELHPGDRVLLFPSCYGEACPPSPSPLGIELPATAAVGEAVPVTVKRFSFSGEASPSPGASVSGGVKAETTDSSGHATLTFSSRGEVTVRATGAESVRDETTICVHAGNDGTCGTQATPSPGAGTPAGGAGTGGGVAGFISPSSGSHALAAHLSGLIEGHVYRAGGAPRVLSGSVLGHAVVSGVSLELRRRDNGRCSAYDGLKERFMPARCGHGNFFKVSSAGVFSYLLPAALGPGRYVLDLEASDAAGERTTLARGSTRFVFYVR
jgi:hypothetical protein